MSSAPPTAPPAKSVPPPKVIPYTFRVSLEADVYDRLLELARRDFRRLEWQASYLLTKAIEAEAATDAA